MNFIKLTQFDSTIYNHTKPTYINTEMIVEFYEITKRKYIQELYSRDTKQIDVPVTCISFPAAINGDVINTHVTETPEEIMKLIEAFYE